MCFAKYHKNEVPLAEFGDFSDTEEHNAAIALLKKFNSTGVKAICAAGWHYGKAIGRRGYGSDGDTAQMTPLSIADEVSMKGEMGQCAATTDIKIKRISERRRRPTEFEFKGFRRSTAIGDTVGSVTDFTPSAWDAEGNRMLLETSDEDEPVPFKWKFDVNNQIINIVDALLYTSIVTHGEWFDIQLHGWVDTVLKIRTAALQPCPFFHMLDDSGGRREWDLNYRELVAYTPEEWRQTEYWPRLEELNKKLWIVF